MNPEIWGPHAWLFLHSITLNYPEKPTKEEKEIYKNFFNNLGKVLPCYKCQRNYEKHIEMIPITKKILSSKKRIIKWLIDIHNLVNKSNGKKEMKEKEMIKKYKKIYEEKKEKKNIKNIIILTIIIYAILLLIYILIIMIKKN